MSNRIWGGGVTRVGARVLGPAFAVFVWKVTFRVSQFDGRTERTKSGSKSYRTEAANGAGCVELVIRT